MTTQAKYVHSNCCCCFALFAVWWVESIRHKMSKKKKKKYRRISCQKKNNFTIGSCHWFFSFWKCSSQIIWFSFFSSNNQFNSLLSNNINIANILFSLHHHKIARFKAIFLRLFLLFTNITLTHTHTFGILCVFPSVGWISRALKFVSNRL